MDFLSRILKKILQEIQNCYSNLCKRDPLSPSEDTLNSFLNNPEMPELSDNDVQIGEGKLTSVTKSSAV